MKNFSLFSWLYPSMCFCCDAELRSPKELLCTSCYDHLEFIPPHMYCEDCFSEKEKECGKEHIQGVNVGAAFETEGPARALLNALYTFEDERYEQLLASFLLVQKKRLRWPSPDVVVPLPSERISLFGMKKTNSWRLSNAFAKLVNVQRKVKQCRDGYLYIIGDVLPKREQLLPIVESIVGHCPKRIFSLNLLTR